MEDQILPVDKTQEATSDVDLSKKLLRKEQRLFVRLQEEQEAEARALDRFQRAQKRLQRSRGRLERIAGKLVFVRKQIADLENIVQQAVHGETEVGAPSSVEIVSSNTLESEGLSSSDTESTLFSTSVLEQEAAPISEGLSDVFAAYGGEGWDGRGHPAPRQGTSSPVPLMSESSEAALEPEVVLATDGGNEQEHPAPRQETSSPASLSSAPFEATSISADSSDVFAANDGEERGNEQGHSVPWQGTSSPTSLTPESIEAMPESETVVAPVGRDEQGQPAHQQETSYLALLTSAPMQAIFEPEAMAASEDITTVTPITTEPEALSISDIDSASTTLAEAEQAASSDSTTGAVPSRESAEAASSIYAESGSSNTIEQEPVASADSPTVETEVDAAPEVNKSSDSFVERKPTQPLRLEQEDQPAAGSFSPDIQSAKEAWVAAESAMQRARNAAHGIAASISYLSQTDGLSNEFMEELVRKQADANKELLKAQEAARIAYERFVQAQKGAEYAASQPVAASMNMSEDHSQQKQKNGALPPAEDNGDDQTAKMHAIRLYKEW